MSDLPYNPNDSSVGRIDQGVDITSASNFTAIEPGTVVHIDPNFYNGTPAIYIRLDQPVKVNGRTYSGMYYAETQAKVRVGQHVKPGQVVSGPGSAEIGFAQHFSVGWLPAAHNSYTEGSQTQAGADFASLIKSGGGGGVLGTVGSVAGGVAHDVASPFESAASGVSGAVSGIGTFASDVTSASFWLRAIELVGGGILMLLGLYLLARQAGVASAPAPGALQRAELSDETAARLQVQPGPRPARPRRRSHDVSEAAERRAAIRRRTEGGIDPATSEIPF